MSVLHLQPLPPLAERQRPPVSVAGPRVRSAPRGESERLAARLADGDRDAFEQLYHRHGSTTFAFLRARLSDRGAAEDVQQQVWLELWERRTGFDPRQASFLTWALLIARSRAVDHQRRRRPEPRDPQTELAAAGTGAEEADTDALLERWRVADALARLPREEAEMLRLRFHEGLSQREIAERTGVALGTVKHRMVDGLARLREALATEAQP